MSRNQELLALARIEAQKKRIDEMKKNRSEQSQLKPIDHKRLIKEGTVIAVMTRLANDYLDDKTVHIKEGMLEDEMFYAINSMLSKAKCNLSLMVDKGCGAKGIALALNALIEKKSNTKDKKNDV